MKRAPRDLYECLESIKTWLKIGAIESVYFNEEMILEIIEPLLTKYKPYKEPFKFVDVTGQTFHELTVLRYVGNLFFECKCSCGVVKNITSYQLRIGRTKSCGHLRRGKRGQKRTIS